MPFPLPACLVCICLATAMSAGAARAATSGTITFSGRIDPGTCDLSISGANREILLDAVKIGDFDDSASAAPESFELRAACESGVSTVTFVFNGTPHPADAVRFHNTGTATGVALWLYTREAGGGTRTLAPAAPGNTATVPVAAGTAVLPLVAAYYRVGAVGTVTSGTLSSMTTVNITYR